MRLSYLVLVPFGLISCGGDKTSDTGTETGGDADTDADSDSDADTDTGSDAAEVTAQGAACAGTVVTYTASTTGTVDKVIVFATDNGNADAYSDNHELTAGGAAGEWSADVDIVAFGSQGPTSTIFTCDDHYNATPTSPMSFAVAAFDGATQVDCVVWGADTEGLVNGTNIGTAEPPDMDLSACHE